MSRSTFRFSISEVLVSDRRGGDSLQGQQGFLVKSVCDFAVEITLCKLQNANSSSNIDF